LDVILPAQKLPPDLKGFTTSQTGEKSRVARFFLVQNTKTKNKYAK
jgi:hypothetical protein